MKKERTLVVVSRTGERILRAVHFYRYMTAVDIAQLLNKPDRLKRVREELSRLCGGVDFDSKQYLYRFRRPKIEAGNPERIFTLGSRGRDFLSRELTLLDYLVQNQ